MVTETPINKLPIPSMTDQINITTALGGLSTAIDTIAIPRYTSLSNRNTAIPNPIYGQMCYVSDTGELYIFKKQYNSWVSAASRVRRVTTAVTNSSTSVYVDVNDLDFSVEADSIYYGRMNMALRGNTAGDLKLRMRGPASCVIRATHIRIIAPSGTLLTHTQVDAFTTWHSGEIIIGLLDPASSYWTANFQLWIDTAGTSGQIDTSFVRNAAAASASEVSEDTTLEIWKVK